MNSYCAPNECTKIEDVPQFLRRMFEKGDVPCDSPPGLTELYYRKWLALGGKVTPPKPVTVDDL